MTAPTAQTPGTDPAPTGRSRRVAVLVGIAVLAIVGVALLVLGLGGAGETRAAAPIAVADDRPPVTVSATPAPAAPGQPPSRPASIDIPAIGVRSVVNAGGLNADGTVEVPAPGPQYDEASWYTGSAMVGQDGPSVILGHIDSARNGPSVFYRLSELRPLDEFTVTGADGRTRVYKVNSVQTYPKDAFPSEAVYGPTPRPEMRLITCGGPFDDSARSYRDNTVVYANQIA